MYVVDLHCDSLSLTNSERGLLTKYNVSAANPYLQVFAAFIPFLGKAPELRRRELMKYVNVYLYEVNRLGITHVDGVRTLYSATDNGFNSAMLSIEGGGGLLADSEELFTLHKMGLRIMSLCWDSNELASSSADENDGGLTQEGRRMAKRCAELGITLDVSHLSDRSFWHVCDAYPLPLIATHSNFRDVHPHRRNLTYEMAKEITARGGVIGLNLYPPFLSDKGDKASAEAILPHVDDCLEKFGDGVLSLGLDIDGTSGVYPCGITEDRSIHDSVINILLARYPQRTVERIVGENALDFLRGVL